jgi:phospholipase D1/2
MNQSKDILAATTGTGGLMAGDSVGFVKRSVDVVQGENGVIQITETQVTVDRQVDETLDNKIGKTDDELISQLTHLSTKIKHGSKDDQVIHESITITKDSMENDMEMINYNRRLSENIQDIRKMVPGSPESLRVSRSLRQTAEGLRNSAENLEKMAKFVDGVAENLAGEVASAQLISSEKIHIVKTNPKPSENLPPVSAATRKQLLKSPSTVKRTTQDTEEVTEHTKKDTPEMERKNVLGKFTENVKSKGRDMLNRMASTMQMEAPSPPPELELELEVQEQVEEEETETVGLDGQAKLWIGKDYTNFILKDFIELDSPFNDLVDRTMTPRMPWHDIATVVIGHTARDAARHFIQRWNAVKLEKARENISYPYLMPKSYVDMRIDENFFPKNKMSMSRVTCQVVRSVSQWSCGYIEADNCEQSIHEAYIQTITKAQHFIYIENQFFISTTYQDQNVKNQITETLSKRILRAHR